MKTKLTMLAMAFSYLVNAQWTGSGPIYPTNLSWKVGIGTNNPLNNLHIVNTSGINSGGITIEKALGSGGAAGIDLNNFSTNGRNWGIYSLGTGDPAGSGNFAIYDLTSVQNRFLIKGSDGNIGIGTSNPGSNKLCINAGVNNAVECNVASDSQKFFQCKNNGNETFQVWGNGNTVIYCKNITPGQNHALVVCDNLDNNKKNFVVMRNGTVYAREIFVQATNVFFPDYVFKKGYKLMPLSELDSYIQKNQHLPNIPSAEQVEKNGLGVGELSKLQMEKIEELTLYVIELQKRIVELERKVSHD